MRKRDCGTRCESLGKLRAKLVGIVRKVTAGKRTAASRIRPAVEQEKRRAEKLSREPEIGGLVILFEVLAALYNARDLDR